MDIRIELNEFYSQLDEYRFFDGIKQIEAIKSVRGVGRGLLLSVDVRRMSNDMFYEIIALFRRYNISMHPLALLAEAPRMHWIKGREHFWHEEIFGISSADQ